MSNGELPARRVDANDASIGVGLVKSVFRLTRFPVTQRATAGPAILVLYSTI
jgi:hypothetical protein